MRLAQAPFLAFWSINVLHWHEKGRCIYLSVYSKLSKKLTKSDKQEVKLLFYRSLGISCLNTAVGDLK